MATSQTEVIIIGAGPTGLSLACQLVRYGIDFVIVEQNEGVTPFSKALGVHARTLEIYEQLGLAEQAIARGAIAGKARFLAGGEIRGEVDLSNIGHDLSAYPYMLVLEQSKNEQLLYEYLQRHGRAVRWQTQLESLAQDAGGVTARITDADGAPQIIEGKYLVGCDGAKSPVRGALGLTFAGSTFERVFYVADVEIDWGLSHDALHICLAHDSFILFFPMQGEKRYRIVGVFPEGWEKEAGEILYEEIEARIKTEAELPLDITNVNWFSNYKVHTRHVDNFSVGRCFLAGDAAHIHSPAGAQGMNTGIQDAYNLAWKLAFARKGNAGERILATYNEERLANAKRLLATTDRMFQLGAGTEPLLGFIRTTVFPSVAQFLLGFDAVKKLLFPLISQIGINYRDCSLSEHRGDTGFAIKAGDRMPYFTVAGHSIYDELRAPKFHLLAFTTDHSPEQTSSDATASDLAALVDQHIVPLDAHSAEIFGTNEPFNVLLRPDNYIAVISPQISPDELRAYLGMISGPA